MRKLIGKYLSISGYIAKVPVVHITDEGKAFCLVGGKLCDLENNRYITFLGYELEA